MGLLSNYDWHRDSLLDDPEIQRLFSSGAEKGYVTKDEVMEIISQTEDEIADLYGRVSDDVTEKPQDDSIGSLKDLLEMIETFQEGVTSDRNEKGIGGALLPVFPLHQYLQIISHIDKVSFIEESDIVQRIRAGESQARMNLAAPYLWDVYNAVPKISRDITSLLALIREGNRGLMVAVDKFDYDIGYTFSDFAHSWYMNALNRKITQTNNINIYKQPNKTHDPALEIEILKEQEYQTISTRLAPKGDLEPAIVEKLKGVLSQYFSNGYRLSSPIELARLKSFATEDLSLALSLPDEELRKHISACGIIYDGKVYVVSTETKERIKELASDYFSDGAQAIFYTEFYARNENWLFGASVVSEDMLTDILLGLFPRLSFTRSYFGYTDVSAFSVLESEILRVWGDDLLLTYSQLSERLWYIPIEKIKYALGQNTDFLWNSVETFTHVSRIDITDTERKSIREAVARKCNDCGYATIKDLPLDEIEERNYELSITATHNAVYRICLTDAFDRRGKIIMRKGDTFDALTIMKEYCQTVDKCSLDDLFAWSKELTGDDQRWIPMEAGNTVLVRIDRNTYVANKFLHFETEAIDDAIGLFVQGDYLPLQSFTTFGAFPDCNQKWNLFLLESYCRRFSRKFRFDTPSVNSRNAGAVIRKSCGMDYTEIVTDAVANADIPLKDTAVGKFLYESGYTGRSTTAKVNIIIDKANAIRERRD